MKTLTFVCNYCKKEKTKASPMWGCCTDIGCIIKAKAKWNKAYVFTTLENG